MPRNWKYGAISNLYIKRTEMSINQICPSVDVVCWNETDLWIHCPYCEELHRHGFVSYKSASRVPHCGLPRPSYQYNFPVALSKTQNITIYFIFSIYNKLFSYLNNIKKLLERKTIS